MNERDLAKLKKQLTRAILHKLEEKQMTHAELAKACGSNRSAITQILSGSRKHVTLDKIFQLAHGAGVEISVILK